VYRNIRAGFDDNLTDYLRQSIPHAFHHNPFLVVSNGDRARYGSITSKWEHFSEWKRNGERETGSVDAQVLLDGMLSKRSLLDLVQNFILFDESRTGGIRKIVARNHQVLGVNNAVESVIRQEALKRQFPPEARSVEYQSRARDFFALRKIRRPIPASPAGTTRPGASPTFCRWSGASHPDLGRLGVLWHTQGSGKSYSMAFFVEKVRRVVPGNFTFLVMTDREALDDHRGEKGLARVAFPEATA